MKINTDEDHGSAGTTTGSASSPGNLLFSPSSLLDAPYEHSNYSTTGILSITYSVFHSFLLSTYLFVFIDVSKGLKMEIWRKPVELRNIPAEKPVASRTEFEITVRFYT